MPRVVDLDDADAAAPPVDDDRPADVNECPLCNDFMPYLGSNKYARTVMSGKQRDMREQIEKLRASLVGRADSRLVYYSMWAVYRAYVEEPLRVYAPVVFSEMRPTTPEAFRRHFENCVFEPMTYYDRSIARLEFVAVASAAAVHTADPVTQEVVYSHHAASAAVRATQAAMELVRRKARDLEARHRVDTSIVAELRAAVHAATPRVPAVVERGVSDRLSGM